MHPFINEIKKGFSIIKGHAEDFDDDFYVGSCIWKKQIWEERKEGRLIREMHREDRKMRERTGRWF